MGGSAQVSLLGVSECSRENVLEAFPAEIMGF